MINWILNNKEWFFSGIGVLMITAFCALFKKVKTSKNTTTNRDTDMPVVPNTQNHTQNVTVNVNNAEPHTTTETVKSADSFSIVGIRAQTNILFIDDDKTFKIVSILKSSGWKNTSFYPNPDVKDINDEKIRNSHIIFIDILGVGRTLYKDEGLGLAADLKKRYPDKKIVIYSAEPAHQSFHEAWKITDDRIQKNAQPAEFISCIQTLAESIWKKD